MLRVPITFALLGGERERERERERKRILPVDVNEFRPANSIQRNLIPGAVLYVNPTMKCLLATGMPHCLNITIEMYEHYLFV